MEILIKVVTQSIPTYTLSSFKIPLTLRKELGQMIAKFWWGEIMDVKKKKKESLVIMGIKCVV